MTDTLLLTATEAAAILRLSVDTIRDMTRDGLPSRVIYGSHEATPAAALDHLAEQLRA